MKTILVRRGNEFHIAFIIVRHQKLLTSLGCSVFPFWLWHTLFIKHNMYLATISAKIYNYCGGLFIWCPGTVREVFLDILVNLFFVVWFAFECTIKTDVSSILILSLLQSRYFPYQKCAKDHFTGDTNREEQTTCLRHIHKKVLCGG